MASARHTLENTKLSGEPPVEHMETPIVSFLVFFPVPALKTATLPPKFSNPLYRDVLFVLHLSFVVCKLQALNRCLLQVQPETIRCLIEPSLIRQR